MFDRHFLTLEDAALDVTADGIRCHGLGFLERVALGVQARQCVDGFVFRRQTGSPVSNEPWLALSTVPDTNDLKR